MGSGVAVIIGAGIGFLGSFLVSAVVPFLQARVDKRERANIAREESLRSLIPRIMTAGASLRAPNPDVAEVGAAMALVAERGI